jgi:hypothetical protein
MLARERIIEAFQRLDQAPAKQGARAELYVVGGAVMCLVLKSRPSTKDVDGWFTEPQAMRRAASQVAREMGLPEDWLDDAATAYVSEGAVFERWQSFDHLDVSMADDRTLLAMKCAAARTEEDSNDIRTLAGRLGLRTASDVLGVVTRFYPIDRTTSPDATARRGALS